MSGTTTAITAAASALAAGLQAVAEAVRNGCADPGDAITLLLQLVDYAPSTLTGSDAIGQAMSTVEAATAAACRRAALSSLALAGSTYQPSSYQDAIAIRDKICMALDAEILLAGDTGDFASYTALRALRVAVVVDLTTRAGTLAAVVTVSRAASQPCLVVAYDLYGDTTRYDDLVQRANPVSPLFMPRMFEALAS